MGETDGPTDSGHVGPSDTERGEAETPVNLGVPHQNFPTAPELSVMAAQPQLGEDFSASSDRDSSVGTASRLSEQSPTGSERPETVSAAEGVQRVQDLVRKRLTPPKGMQATFGPLPAFSGRAKSLKEHLPLHTATRQPASVTATPIPQSSAGEGGNDGGNGGPNKPFEIPREVDPSESLVRFAANFEKVGWHLETPKLPNNDAAMREFIHMWCSFPTEKRIRDAIQLLNEDKVLEKIVDAIKLLNGTDASEKSAEILDLLEGVSDDEDVCLAGGIDEVLKILRNGSPDPAELKQAVKSLIKIGGQLYYERLASLIAYFSGRIPVQYEAAILGFQNLVDFILKPDGTPRSFMEAGCGDADLLRGVDKIRKKYFLHRPLEDHVDEANSLRKSPVREKIREVQSRPDRIRDPHLLGLDYTANFPERLELEKNINAVQGDMSDPELFEQGLPYLKKGSMDIVVMHAVLDRLTDVKTALRNGREAAAEGARFHIGLIFPIMNVGDSMTEGVPQIPFWDPNGDMRAEWMGEDENAVKMKILFDLRLEGYAAEIVGEHKHAVISPHSYMSVKEFRDKYANDPEIIDMNLYDEELRQKVSNALQKPFPEYGVAPTRETAENERILVPQHYRVFDIAGRILK